MAVNNNYDSEFCGSLPLNLINLIQPYGVLMVVEKKEWTIVQVSENIEDIIGVPVSEMVNSSLQQYLPAGQLEAVQEKFSIVLPAKIPVRLQLLYKENRFDFLALVQDKGTYFVFELEPYNVTKEASFVDVYQDLKYVMEAIEQTSSVEALCQLALKELKKASGFDRIIIYQFDEDWNGSVIAEVVEEGMPSYMGLKFPASDIPRQARELYLRAPYRFIPNRDYQPVKIYPVINPLTHAFIDLSDTNLRGVAAVHLEYMKNMGIMASMSLRILCNGKLWGIITCHHRTARPLTYEQCSLLEMLSNVLSARITALLNKERFSFNSKLQDTHNRLVEQVYTRDSLVEGLLQQEINVLHLLNAAGAALVYGRDIHLLGQTPDKAAIREMVYWLDSQQLRDVYVETALSDAYDQAKSYVEVASGLIVLPIYPGQGAYLIGFRPELIKTVNWGGNPNNAIQFEPDRKKYHPRNSFKLWQETVQHTALAWNDSEKEAAAKFKNAVFEYLAWKALKPA